MDLTTIENNIESIVSPEDVENPQTPILIDGVLYEENLRNITLTVFIDISEKPGVMENIQLGQTCSLAKIKAYMALFKELRDVLAWSMTKCLENIHPSFCMTSRPILMLNLSGKNFV